MPLRKILPKSYSIRLILMMFFFGLIPFIIFGFLMNTFDHRFRVEMDQAIQQGQEEEDRRSRAVLTQMAEDAIRQKALDVALQLKLYIEARPSMTVAQLQNDSEAGEIAVQPLFQTGYTAVYSGDNSVTFFHKNPAIVNLDLSTLADKLNDFWLIIKHSLGGKYSHGYYEWKDADGELRTKFMYIAPVLIKTADKVRLMVAATAYVDEFTRPIRITQKVSHGTSRFLAMTFQHLIGTFKQMGFIFLGIGLLINLALAFWAGTYFSKTITHLRGATKSVMNGQLDVRVTSNMTGDVGELTEDFNHMVSHLETTTVRKEELEANQEELKTANVLLHEEVRERQRAEVALRESEERFRAILETNPNPIVVYSKHGVPEYFNLSFSDVFGWSLDELKGLQIPFIPEEMKKETIEKLSDVYRSAKIVSFESQRLTSQGHITDVLVSAAPFKGPHSESAGMVVNYTDITEIKRLKVQLQHAQKMEAIGTLAGGIAHNFNNVLMGIIGLTSLMLMQKDPSDPDYKHLMSIEEYGKNAAELTKDLLAFARGGKYEVKPTDLNQIIQHEADMFGRTKRELTVSGEYGQDLWTVETDQGQMRQMLMNLYVNAWQAMPEGGHLYITTENVVIHEDYIVPFEISAGRYVKISLTDTGRGMDEETKGKIFDPFFTTREIGSGTGLGLASVYGIIKNHNGFINVYSELGKGTTFNIYLPASNTQVKIEKAPDRLILKGTETILLVDDEEMIIDVGGQILETLGYRVISAKNGVEALDVYDNNKDKIDIVLLDMIMPGMSAEEIYGRLKEKDSNIKVLLASGYTINGRAEEIMALGCNGFIQKPFNIQDLSRKIRKILDGA